MAVFRSQEAFTQFGSVQVAGGRVVSAEQKTVLNGHAKLIAATIKAHVTASIAALPPAKATRFPADKLPGIYREAETALYASLLSRFPTRDVRRLAGQDLNGVAREAATSFLALLEKDGGMALAMLGDRAELTSALEARIKEAFARLS